MQKFIVLTALLILAAQCNAEDEWVQENEIESSSGKLERPIGMCTSGSDCQNGCSVMGMTRFTEPRCSPKGQLGSTCIVGNEPQNKTLSFPNSEKKCSDVYMLYCPCEDGLVCERAKCRRPRQTSRSRSRARARDQ